MDALQSLIAGFGVALQPANLLWGFVGVTLGTPRDPEERGGLGTLPAEALVLERDRAHSEEALHARKELVVQLG